jgi:hypothetical protein
MIGRVAEKNKSRRSISPARLADLERLTVIKPIRADSVDLTEAERKFLRDPNWITEGEAEAIVAERIYQREADKAMPLREYLKSRGIQVAD